MIDLEWRGVLFHWTRSERADAGLLTSGEHRTRSQRLWPAQEGRQRRRDSRGLYEARRGARQATLGGGLAVSKLTMGAFHIRTRSTRSARVALRSYTTTARQGAGGWPGCRFPSLGADEAQEALMKLFPAGTSKPRTGLSPQPSTARKSIGVTAPKGLKVSPMPGWRYSAVSVSTPIPMARLPLRRIGSASGSRKIDMAGQAAPVLASALPRGRRLSGRTKGTSPAASSGPAGGSPSAESVSRAWLRREQKSSLAERRRT